MEMKLQKQKKDKTNSERKPTFSKPHLEASNQNFFFYECFKPIIIETQIYLNLKLRLGTASGTETRPTHHG